MQTSDFGKSRGLWETLKEGSWSEAFDGLGISLLLTSNPAIQVTNTVTIDGLFPLLIKFWYRIFVYVIEFHAQQYTVFDQLKQRVLQLRHNKVNNSVSGSSPIVISAYSAFVVGAISKTIATVATYPAIR